MQTGSIYFAQPQWLWLIPLLIILHLLLRKHAKEGDASALATGSTRNERIFFHPLIAALPKSIPGVHKTPVHHLLHAVVSLLIIISLCEPVRVGERLPDPPQERDIVFIVDSSISMTLRDYVLEGERVDRMTLLKAVLDRFVQRLEGERIGLIVFGDSAYTLVPLTRDQGLVRHMLKRIEATMVGRFNAMSEGIALAVKQAGPIAEGEERRHRILVMLTDGDKATGQIKPQAAAELAREAGIPLYTVAIGATTESAEEERIAGLIYEPVDLPLLKFLAQHTGGETFQAGDSQAFEQAIQTILQQEQNRREVAPQYYQEPLYLWPLLSALLLLFISALGLAHMRRVNARAEVRAR